MNKWLRRAVGTVGIAGGVWLLGSGAAHADASTTATDAQLPTTGVLDSLFTPTGGPNNLGLTLDRATTALPAGPMSFTHGATDALQQGGAVPGLLESLPVTDVLPMGGIAPLTGAGQTEGLPQLPLLGSLPLDGILPLGALPTGVLPVAGGLPTDDVPIAGTLTRSLDAGAPADLTGTATGLTDALPVFDSLTGALPLAGANGAGQTQESGLDGLPLVGSLPVVGGLTDGGLPLVGSLPVVGGLTGGGLPLVGSLPLVGGLLGGGADATPNQTEGVPVVESLPLVGTLLQGDSGLPVLGPLLGGLPVGQSALPGQSTGNEALPIFDSLPMVGGLA